MSPLSPTAAGTGQTLADVGITRIRQIAVVVHDVSRATRFYRDVLGLQLLFEAPPGLAFFDCGGVRLMLSPPEGAAPERADVPASSILYYEVADIHAAYNTLVARGVQSEGPPHVVATLADCDVWLAELRDTEGNRLALICEAPRATS